jgi:hypothetical protein
LRWKNIGPAEREKRKLFGIAAIAVVALLAASHGAVPDLLWVLAVGFMAWSAVLCLLQWWAGVCVFHAALGLKNFDRGPSPIRSERMKRIIRGRAVRLHLLAATGWGIVTTLCAVAAT